MNLLFSNHCLSSNKMMGERNQWHGLGTHTFVISTNNYAPISNHKYQCKIAYAVMIYIDSFLTLLISFLQLNKLSDFYLSLQYFLLSKKLFLFFFFYVNKIRTQNPYTNTYSKFTSQCNARANAKALCKPSEIVTFPIGHRKLLVIQITSSCLLK